MDYSFITVYWHLSYICILLLQESTKASLHHEVTLPHEAHVKQLEPHAEMKEVEEEEDYDLDQADIIREAPSLDAMAKLITVEEVSTCC